MRKKKQRGWKTRNIYEQVIIFDLKFIINEYNVCFKIEISWLDGRANKYYSFSGPQVQQNCKENIPLYANEQEKTVRRK